MTETILAPLDFYAAHGAALFPIPFGSKAPFGIISSFAHDWSRDPAQWASWRTSHPDCNFGLVAGPSRLVIVDVDVAEVGREVAWAEWTKWCTSHDLPVFTPTTQSARGGWHILFSLPVDLDIATLRQCPLVGKIEGVSKKAIIDLRVGSGFVVAAGSYYDGTAKGEESGPYLLMSPSAPHPAPAALLAACTRAVPKATPSALPGSRDKGDVAALLRWMTDKEMFSDYSDWLNAGLALKIEYGDDGLSAWEICHDTSVTADTIASKWQSFATDPLPGMTTLNSLLQRAHAAGWTGSVRKSSASMFSEVAQLAANSGASLSSGMPTPGAAAGFPMMSGEAEHTRIAAPALAEFLASTVDLAAPSLSDFPALPTGMSGHGLYSDMQAALIRIASLAGVKPFKTARIGRTMITLGAMHREIFDSVCRRLNAMGHTLPDKKWRQGIANTIEEVQRITVTHEKWETDPKTGKVEADNPDNILVLLGMLGLEIRYNMWLEQMEVQGTTDPDFFYPEWTYVDDRFVAKLITRAKRTKTRFCPGKDFTWESLIAFSDKNRVDPVFDTLATLESGWDRTPRLSHWLSETCGVPDDIYHQTVAKIIIGGMVRRIRQPGCKHDFIPVFFGPQGTGKSTIAKIIADMGTSTLAQIDMRSAPWFSDEVMLGDESKELVLSLAGKCLVEIGEMGQRSSANTDHAKAMLSRQVDRGRTAYARAVTNRPRRNIFFGTVNGSDPLQDTSGNRRYLPVATPNELNLQWLSDNIAQIIGEAATLESNGATFAMPKEVYAIATEHQEAARSVSDVEALLSEWFALTPHTAQAFVSLGDLAELASLSGWKGQHTLRNAVLRRLGFREAQPYLNGVKTKGWYRGPEALAKHAATATRYGVGRAGDGRVRVVIRAGGGVAGGTLPPCPILPPLPY